MTALTKEEKLTRDSYDKSATLWSAAHLNYGFWAEELKEFKKLLPRGRLLEVGCGGGRDAKDLQEVGYSYFGTDISAELIKEARKNNPGTAFEVASLYDLDYKEKFDGFWCSAVLMHIPKERMDEALQSIKRNVKPGGMGFISIKKGKGEMIEQREDFAGQKFYFAFWQSGDFKKKLHENGFEVISEGYKPMSQRSRWLTYIVRTE